MESGSCREVGSNSSSHLQLDLVSKMNHFVRRLYLIDFVVILLVIHTYHILLSILVVVTTIVPKHVLLFPAN